jgi:hypothetical protein
MRIHGGYIYGIDANKHMQEHIKDTYRPIRYPLN